MSKPEQDAKKEVGAWERPRIREGKQKMAGGIFGIHKFLGRRRRNEGGPTATMEWGIS